MSRILVVVVCLMAIGISFAQDGAQDGLATELKLLEDDVAQANKKCLTLEHDAVYNDESCKAVYAEVKKIEKQLFERKKLLSEKLDNVPEVHQARAARKLAYNRLLAFKKMNGLVAQKEAK